MNYYTSDDEDDEDTESVNRKDVESSFPWFIFFSGILLGISGMLFANVIQYHL